MSVAAQPVTWVMYELAQSILKKSVSLNPPLRFCINLYSLN